MYRSAGEKGVAGSLGPSGESGVQPDNEVWVSYGRKSPASDGLKLDVAHKNNAMKPGIVVFQRRFDFIPTPRETIVSLNIGRLIAQPSPSITGMALILHESPVAALQLSQHWNVRNPILKGELW